MLRYKIDGIITQPFYFLIRCCKWVINISWHYTHYCGPSSPDREFFKSMSVKKVIIKSWPKEE